MTQKPEDPLQSITALPQQYRGAIDMLAPTNRRVANTRFYISLNLVLIVLLTFAARPGFDSALELRMANIVACISLLTSLNWYLMAHSIGQLARIQRFLLKEMEIRLPYNFVTRQEQQPKGSYKLMRTGLIKNTVPFPLMIPALLILIMVNF